MNEEIACYDAKYRAQLMIRWSLEQDVFLNA